ncbi:MAG: hypothetical protein EOP00_21010 [Pedobacter sp.]|nr:MAG: hypothetical protein EOP00_21010 [Pedobacter sp.]
MAKEIKAIKCPNCGSVNKIELKPDFYKCTSCQTEYFLDDNDVNINYNHNFNNGNQFTDHSKTIKIVGIVIGCIIGFFVLVSILIGVFSSSKKSSNYVYSTPAATTKEEIDSGYSASRYTSFAFLVPSSKQPVVIFLESRRYNDRSYETKNGTYLAYYSLLKKELLAETKMSDESLSSSDVKIRTFSDGNIYITNNKTSLLKLNKENFKTEDVGKKFFEANTELQVGVATMELVYDHNGDGLVLLTNDGKKRYYYPLIQKLYTEDAYRKASYGFESLLPSASTKTIYTFSSESSEYPEEKLQLMRVIFKDNGAGPKNTNFNLRWWKDYGRSGIFTGGEPYRKVLISAYGMQSSRVLSIKDITPERLYFSPSVLVDEDQTLIIKFKGDANVKSPYKLQKINPQNGAVEWTTSLPTDTEIELLMKYKDGFAGTTRKDEIILLDNKGNITSTYKLD